MVLTSASREDEYNPRISTADSLLYRHDLKSPAYRSRITGAGSLTDAVDLSYTPHLTTFIRHRQEVLREQIAERGNARSRARLSQSDGQRPSRPSNPRPRWRPRQIRKHTPAGLPAVEEHERE